MLDPAKGASEMRIIALSPIRESATKRWALIVDSTKSGLAIPMLTGMKFSTVVDLLAQRDQHVGNEFEGLPPIRIEVGILLAVISRPGFTLAVLEFDHFQARPDRRTKGEFLTTYAQALTGGLDVLLGIERIGADIEVYAHSLFLLRWWMNMAGYLSSGC